MYHQFAITPDELSLLMRDMPLTGRVLLLIKLEENTIMPGASGFPWPQAVCNLTPKQISHRLENSVVAIEHSLQELIAKGLVRKYKNGYASQANPFGLRSL